jgi:hypothetical protein
MRVRVRVRAVTCGGRLHWAHQMLMLRNDGALPCIFRFSRSPHHVPLPPAAAAAEGGGGGGGGEAAAAAVAVAAAWLAVSPHSGVIPPGAAAELSLCACIGRAEACGVATACRRRRQHHAGGGALTGTGGAEYDDVVSATMVELDDVLVVSCHTLGGGTLGGEPPNQAFLQCVGQYRLAHHGLSLRLLCELEAGTAGTAAPPRVFFVPSMLEAALAYLRSAAARIPPGSSQDWGEVSRRSSTQQQRHAAQLSSALAPVAVTDCAHTHIRRPVPT